MAKTSSKYTSPIQAALLEGATLVSGYSASSGPAIPQQGNEDFPNTVGIEREWSGLTITWDLATLGFNEIRIVRKERDYAYSVVDGLTVYEGDPSPGTFTDTTTVGVRPYYYTLWFRNSSGEPWQNRYWLRLWDIALAPNDVPDLLWSLLPAMYKRNEEERDNSKDMNLLVNRVLAPPLREIEDLTDFFPSLLDVDETPGPNLESIARYIGLTPNLELTYIQQREEIKGAVESYKTKGLRTTLERMARAISGLTSNVIDWNQHLLITNWEGKTTLVVDPVAGFNSLLPGDNSFRTLDITGGQQFDTATYGVYLTVPLDRSVGERTVRKLYRSLGNFAPVYMEMDLQLVAEVPPTDQFGSITETSWIEVEDEQSGADDFTPQNFLTSNTLGSTNFTEDIVTLQEWPEDAGAEEVS